MMRIVHLTPATERFYAVFAAEDGTPEFRPVVAWACMEHVEKSELRCVAGVALGKHAEAADFDPAFVGYDPGGGCIADEWADRCKARRAWVESEKQKKAGQKIIVPPKAGIEFPGSN